MFGFSLEVVVTISKNPLFCKICYCSCFQLTEIEKYIVGVYNECLQCLSFFELYFCDLNFFSKMTSPKS